MPPIPENASIDRETRPETREDILEKKVAELKDRLEMAELIFNHIQAGVMCTDKHGIVTHFNQPYGRFLGVDPELQIGRPATEVVENSRLHIVAQTRQAEINVRHRIKGQDMVVQRIPLMKDGEVIGVFGQVIFKDVRDVSKLAKKLRLLETKVKQYEEELTSLRSTRYTLESIAGRSRAILDLKKEAKRAAATRLPVLITGESGTGKELFAQAIHHASERRLKPFIRINCAAIPRELFESELFGYAKGAFTGAVAGGKPGKFELAAGGTVFLDEIGDLPMEMQPKLLRVLEEKEFERVGGNRLIKSDFRLIAATNQNLEDKLSANSFRKDLFYRLSAFPIHIPPLRERPEDIAPLARRLLDAESGHAPGGTLTLSPEALRILEGHTWPGNVRELFNVLERALSVSDGQAVEARDLPFYLARGSGKTVGNSLWDLKEAVNQAEKEAILRALEAGEGNKARAARLLGIHRTLLYRKMRRHGLCPEDLPPM